MALLPVDEAMARMLSGVERLETERVPLLEAGGRVLAAPLTALRTQPPFDASAMDGYAVRAADVAKIPAQLTVIGESAAGRRFSGIVGTGEAVRIFTGAPVPEGTDTILVQENAEVFPDGRRINARASVGAGRHIRRAGLDFTEGDPLLDEGCLLDAATISLAAAANHATLPVVRRPRIAILATGDELVLPGNEPGPDQIVASNSYGIATMAQADGARVYDLGIVPDDQEAITEAIRHALEIQVDVIATLGGASVGARDLVHGALLEAGMELDFWKIAMRPGKPLMVGKFGRTRVLGLPGNPVSSLVCAHLFLRPLIARLAGRSFEPAVRDAVLAVAIRENDERRDYMRARIEAGPTGPVATPFERQDSSMLTTLATANALIIREPFAPAATAGSPCRVLMLR
ncbi:molybdopterin molybdotransferase [Mesorhizobium sp. J18]|uniref:molybdopterin molybdotransferase MoeA n=1 Tax=Mesorhizobium sp. J18 TaxID=935263 RepID=UPI00119BB1F7|nr:gephyrin-like molybdotransferase Glp [Mesorhizobium sp. J18]TWG99106.1 molybdopterin molybdotransferase [Mesorhizobium sp. J18]